MNQNKQKLPWTRGEDWLLAAPLLIILCAFSGTFGKEILRGKMGWPAPDVKPFCAQLLLVEESKCVDCVLKLSKVEKMKWFGSLDSHKKITLGAGFMFLVMAVAFFIGYTSITSLQKSQGMLAESDVAAMDLLNLKDQLTRQRQLILRMILTTDRSEQKELEANIKNRAQEIDDLLDKFIAEAGSDPELKSKLVELKEVRAASQKTRDEQVIPLIYEGKTEQSKALLLGIQQQRFERVRQLSKNIGEHAQNHAKEVAGATRRNAERSLTAFTIAIAIALILGVGVMIGFAREPHHD